MQLTEKELKAYITEAVRQELNEMDEGLGKLIGGAADLAGKAAKKGRGPVTRFVKNVFGNNKEIKKLQNAADIAEKNYNDASDLYDAAYSRYKNLPDNAKDFGATQASVGTLLGGKNTAYKEFVDATDKVADAKNAVRRSRIVAGTGLGLGLGRGAIKGINNAINQAYINKQQKALDKTIGTGSAPAGNGGTQAPNKQDVLNAAGLSNITPNPNRKR